MQSPQYDLTPWRLTLPVMPTRHPAPRAAHIAHLFRNCCSNNDDILNSFCLFQFIVGFCFQSRFFDAFIWQKKNSSFELSSELLTSEMKKCSEMKSYEKLWFFPNCATLSDLLVKSLARERTFSGNTER